MNNTTPDGKAEVLQAARAVTVTASDSADISIVDGIVTDGVALFIGGAGDVTVDMAGSGTNITFSSIQAGTFLPILVKRVYSTGTTATSIVAVY